MDSTDAIQEKCDRKIETLMKRHLERKLDYEKEQETKKSTNAENEKVEYFERAFNEKRQQIQSDIMNLTNLTESELPTSFNNIYKDILTLQKYVAASNIFLRTYDIKIYQQALQNLSNQTKDLEEQLLPKKKFGFKNRKAKPNGTNGTVSVKPQEEEKTEPDSACMKSTLLENNCDFVNERNKSLILDGDEILKKDIALTNLENCKVKLFGSPSTLHMNALKNCYVFCGPVSTSIFAENCEDCTFVIACQQLRLHSSTNVNIYLHVTSRAIMEDCNRICVAPYNLQYRHIKEDFQESGLDMSINNWTSVDDFNWLNIEKKSPHWDTLDEKHRITSWEKYV